MGMTTFQGPVRSLNGFIGQGPGMVQTVPNGSTTLTLDVASYAGRIIYVDDAAMTITLPTIIASADSPYAGPGSDPNNTNNLGSRYTFYIARAATALKIGTDGTDKFVGAIEMVATDAAGATTAYAPAAANDFINLNGTTTGGIVGSYIVVTAIAAAQYMVQGVLLGSGVVATPFANS